MKATAGLAFACFLVALGALTWSVYHPGLNGTFLFDDFANLPNLGQFGPVDNLATFWRYLTSGSADPVGRPLSLLSFLIDANDWPAAPYAFKRTGLLLHFINGALLCWLLLQLGRILGKPERQAQSAALLGTAFWLLHPLFVSTTLYVVQREAMLPTTFILLGLIGYVGGRSSAARGRRTGIFVCALSLVICTLLAVLSKANGALLPLLALVVDSLLLAPSQAVIDPRTKHVFARLRRTLLVAPSVLLLAYLAKTGYRGFVDGLPAIRPWTLGERLLTEARILVDYLGLLWMPRPYTAGLFNDAYVVSTGLVSPPATLLCLVIVVVLLAAAWTQRERYPAFAAAILFFFAGHLLESTVVPLELYYEHRNYAPALLMFWPLALWLTGSARARSAASVVPGPMPTLPPLVRGGLATVLIIGLASMTFLRADLWGSVDDQALMWARKNPDSARAQAYAAQIELGRGQVDAAIKRLREALARKPDEIQLSLNMVGAKCKAQALSSIDLEHAATALRTAPNTGRLGYDWFERALSTALAGSCPGLDLDALDRLLVAAGENSATEKIPGRAQDRLHLQGRIALLRRDDQHALRLFDAALDADPRPGAALEQAAILATNHRPELAQQHLDHLAQVWRPPTGPGWTMASFHSWLLWRQGYWTAEIAHLRKLLAEDIADDNGKSFQDDTPTTESTTKK